MSQVKSEVGKHKYLHWIQLYLASNSFDAQVQCFYPTMSLDMGEGHRLRAFVNEVLRIIS